MENRYGWIMQEDQEYKNGRIKPGGIGKCVTMGGGGIWGSTAKIKRPWRGEMEI